MQSSDRAGILGTGMGGGARFRDRYPTVKREEARIRISVTGWLSENEIEYSIQILEKAKKKFNLK